MERSTPENLRALTGVDRVPMPADGEVLRQAVARHTPASLVGSGAVLVDVQVSADGEVRGVEVVHPPAAPAGTRTVAVARDRQGGTETERQLERPDNDPALAAAARALLREVSFTPALRDGKPVPYTLRMTLRFRAKDTTH